MKKATVKFPKCKNETMNEVMKFMHERYGITYFEVRWELSLASWELRAGGIMASYDLPLLIVCRYEPTVIEFYDNMDYRYHTKIDTKTADWKDLLSKKLDTQFLVLVK